MTPESRRILIGITFGIALAHLCNFIYFPILVSKLGTEFTAGVLFDLSFAVGRPGVNWILIGALAVFASLFLALQSAPLAANIKEPQV